MKTHAGENQAPGAGNIRLSTGQHFPETAALILVLAAAVWLYRKAFLSFFIQDDFAWLVLSRFSSVGDLLKCFVRFNPAGTYRPLSQEVYFGLSQTVFGLWPPGFHIISMAAHLTAVALLLYVLLRRFVGPLAALTASFCYAIHGAHVTSLFWISAFPEPLAMVFLLAAVLMFVRFDRQNSRRAWAFSLAAMACGIMSKESVLSLPLILAAYCLLFARSRLPWVLPHFLMSSGYMLCRMLSGISLAPYDLNFGAQALANLRSYLSWMAGVISDPMPSGWNWNLQASYPAIALAFAALVGALFLIAPNKRLACFALLWMACALQPVLYFSGHIYPYYLAPALAGLAFLAAAALESFADKARWKAWLPALLVAGVCLWLSIGTIRAEGAWWIQRAATRREFIQKLLSIDRVVPEGETALIFGLQPDEFEKLEGGTVLKTYRLSSRKLQFMLPELDSGLEARMSRLVETGAIRQAHCFQISPAGVEDLTLVFRSEPLKFVNRAPVRFIEGSAVRLEVSPAIIRRGVDTLRLRVSNLDAQAVDLLYTIDGQLMPPALQWRLDSRHEAAIFADMTTPEGDYHFQAVRPSGADNSAWIKVNARVTVR